MRISHVLAFAVTLSATASAFADPSIPPSQPNTVTVQAASRAHKLTSDEAAGMDGVFELKDGRTLTVSHRYNKVFAKFDGKREELVPVGGNRFVSRDSGAEVTFNQLPFADEVVLDQAAH